LGSPIGIFDSGIGGLTVAAAVKKAMPNHPLIYFGDTAHLPYGDKSAQAIQEYISRISNFLVKKGCQDLIVACNTASSVLTPKILPTSLNSCFNVVDPVVDFIIANPELNNIGVIGTRQTVFSHIYEKKLLEKKGTLQVFELATPLLAPMIEEGFVHDSIAETVIQQYLSQLPADLDALVLGCTHYPLIKDQIADFLGSKILLVDAPELIARLIVKQFSSTGAEKSKDAPVDRFYVSDYTKSFEAMAKQFFGDQVSLIGTQDY
jgi:glutamate racemase